MSDEDPVSDGGHEQFVTQAELYDVVYAAVRDALLSVANTLFLLAVAAVLIFAGGTGLTETSDPIGYIFAAVFILGGFGLAAYATDVL
jgi:hypothetical protein